MLSSVLVCTRYVYAATRIVTTTQDGGVGSLRQAILDAQPGDAIVFNPGVFSASLTLQLAGQIEVSKSLTIDGSGAGIVTPTLSGFGYNRIFQVDSGIMLSINRLNLSNGVCSGCMGGAIYVASNASVDITHVTLTNNTADAGGAIVNYGLVRLSDTAIMNNHAAYGGAIRNFGVLVANRVIIAGNTAVYGGAIRNSGNTETAVLSLNNSAIYNNSATQYGGGIHNLYPANASMTNTTFVNNIAVMDGGAIWNGADAALNMLNATLYQNISTGSGGGISNAGQASLANSIIAASTGGNCAGSAAYLDLGGNLEDMNSCGLGPFQVTASWATANPLLGAFGDNLPGDIPTVTLLRNSLAINHAVDALCPPTDARGVSRQQGGHCDIGAYETFANAIFIPLALR